MKAHNKTLSKEAREALRMAAALGPGFRGRRQEPSAEDRAQVRERLEALKIDPPAYLDRDQQWVDRKAKLFEAGDYPDKGLTVTRGHLERLQESFDLPVPVLIEHASTPFEMGFLTDVKAEGGELFGTLSLTKEANDLIEASGARSLSLGLDPGLSRIEEVSLVNKPRVSSARLFSGEVCAQEDWRAECERLRAQLQEKHVSERLDELIRAGRLVPAQVPFVQALVQAEGQLVFDGSSVPVTTLVWSLLESGASHHLLEERAPAGTAPEPPLNHDERAFYDRYFAGLSLEEIARNRTA